MEKVKVPILVLLLLMIGMIGALKVVKPWGALSKEKTLHRVPAELPGWTSRSYEMDQEALNVLKPDEYLARVYMSADGDLVDFVILASTHTGAFHNPQVCFRAQMYEFTENREDVLEVPGLNRTIPIRVVRVARMDNPDQRSVGIYFYRTPTGFYTDTSTARIWLFLGRLVGIRGKAYFVRFIAPNTGDFERDLRRLKGFAARLLKEMKETNPEIIS